LERPHGHEAGWYQFAKNSMNPNPFYLDCLQKELGVGRLRLDDKILVACGGNLDRVTLLAAGFKHVTITNLAAHNDFEDYTPYEWEHQNVEKIQYPDGSFDAAIVHSGLHHCRSPLSALSEMCRVSRKMVMAFEPLDSLVTKIGALLGVGQLYEDQAVHQKKGLAGGVMNTSIPNFVYRFSPREIEKMARALFPYGRPRVRFYYAMRANTMRIQRLKNPYIRIPATLAMPAFELLSKTFKLLNNNLCFVVEKPLPEDFFPWIRCVNDQPEIHCDYLLKKYGPFPN
jgi:SAM-dependent methyltransferase